MRRFSISKFMTVGAVFALGTVAGIALAASERYDSATDHTTKAVALLKAIESQRPVEKAQREMAIKQLEGALIHIAKAKEAADKPLPKPTPAPSASAK